MGSFLKQLFLAFTFNSCLFLVLILGIQNSLNKSKVNFLKTNSIELPLSFIIGSSFISGSIVGSLLTFKYKTKDD